MAVTSEPHLVATKVDKKGDEMEHLRVDQMVVPMERKQVGQLDN